MKDQRNVSDKGKIKKDGIDDNDKSRIFLLFFKIFRLPFLVCPFFLLSLFLPFLLSFAPKTHGSHASSVFTNIKRENEKKNIKE